MRHKTLIAYLTNGLGNRLLPLASAMACCQLTGRRLQVYWDDITPTGCLAPLPRLFQNRFETVSLADVAALAGHPDLALFTERPNGQGVRREADRYGRHALLALAQTAPPRDAQALRLDEPAEVVVTFGNELLEGVPRTLSLQALRSLVPAADVLARVRAQAQSLGLHAGMPGVHARGTDFEVRDALALYADAIRSLLGDQRFYLSTEDAALEAGLRQRFGSRLVSRQDRLHLQLGQGKQAWSEPDSYVNSVAHGVDALTDLYLLSCVRLEVAHPDSTFAAVARHLHGVLDGGAVAVPGAPRLLAA